VVKQAATELVSDEEAAHLAEGSPPRFNFG
jgi:hypothetical protein